VLFRSPAIKSIHNSEFGLKISMHEKNAAMARLYTFLGIDVGDPSGKPGEPEQITVYELPAKRALALPDGTTLLTTSPAEVDVRLPEKRVNGLANAAAAPDPDPDDELA